LERAGVPDLPLVSLAKREELVFSLDRSDPLRLSRREPGLQLLQQVRDESHRFGIEYHRLRRSRRTLHSKLLEVEGIGPARYKALMRTFGSLKAIREATPDELTRVPGIGPELAVEIARQLKGKSGPSS